MAIVWSGGILEVAWKKSLINLELVVSQLFTKAYLGLRLETNILDMLLVGLCFERL